MYAPRMMPHRYSMMLSMLVATAREFSQTEQLRERLSYSLGMFIGPDHPHTRTDEKPDAPKPAAYIFLHPNGPLFWQLMSAECAGQRDVVPVYFEAPAKPAAPEKKHD
jgi:hypothetical protein